MALMPSRVKKLHRLVVFFDVLKILFFSSLFVLAVRLFVAEPFIVSGDSMSPTFSSNDFIVIDELSYQLRDPQRGDVVVFHYPADPSIYFIKRIIGLPGDTVRVHNARIFVETPSHTKEYLLSEPYLHSGAPAMQTSTTTLSEDEYFVLGDNRNESFDSRVWGPVPRRYIVGRASVRLYPFSNDALKRPVYDVPEATTTHTIHRQ